MYVWSWYLNIHWFVHMMFIVYRRNSTHVQIQRVYTRSRQLWSDRWSIPWHWGLIMCWFYWITRKQLPKGLLPFRCSLNRVEYFRSWVATSLHVPYVLMSRLSHIFSCLYLWMYDVPSLFFSTRQCSWGKIQLAWVARWRQRYHSFLSWKFKLCT